MNLSVQTVTTTCVHQSIVIKACAITMHKVYCVAYSTSNFAFLLEELLNLFSMYQTRMVAHNNPAWLLCYYVDRDWCSYCNLSCRYFLGIQHEQFLNNFELKLTGRFTLVSFF